jgi:hypothetical protein
MRSGICSARRPLLCHLSVATSAPVFVCSIVNQPNQLSAQPWRLFPQLNLMSINSPGAVWPAL